MIKLVTIIGARPQIIKAAALSRAIRTKYSNQIQEIIVHTGQHYDENMSDVFFKELGIPQPNYNLNIGSGKHGEQSAKMISGIEKILLSEKPNFIILYGDTNSTLAGAIAASKTHIPVVHIEAGLRSFNKQMPEEINRIVCDHCSSYLFTPTKTGYQNLLNEGFKINKPPYTIDNPAILNLGDIMYDNTLYFSEIAKQKSEIILKLKIKNKEFLLATVHRDYNTDNEKNLTNIIKAFNYISQKYHTNIIFPVHPRAIKKIESLKHIQEINEFLNNDMIQKIDPVSFLDMILLEKYAKLILTDSGGVQKEAYFFNKPCIILRTETEWVEIMETGKAILTASSYEKIITAFNSLYKQKETEFPKIFGKGNAADLICEEILKKLLMDFTLKTYKTLLNSLLQKSFSFQTFHEYVDKGSPLGDSRKLSGGVSAAQNKTIILRHDVDKLPENSLRFAQIQHELGIKGTYYFRIVPESLHPEIIEKIAKMGHEIGYHYEDIDLAVKSMKNEKLTINNEGEIAEKAIELFEKHLDQLRKYYPVKTICMHGSPMSKYDNKLLWKYYNYRDYGIIGEPYFDVDFSKVLYLTDTGRRWDGDRVSIRDKVSNSNDQSPITNHQFAKTKDIIQAIEKGRLLSVYPEQSRREVEGTGQIMFTFHPQRWTDKPLPWIKELVWQNTKNIIKGMLLKTRQ